MTTPAKVVVRKVDPTAPPATDIIRAIHQKCGLPIESDYFESGHWWIAYLNGEAAGFAGMVPSHQWANAGYMCRVGVLPFARGRKFQRRLIRARVAKARALGWDYLVTDTTDNVESANNLIACGFRLYHPKNPWAFEESLYWIKRLSKPAARA